MRIPTRLLALACALGAAGTVNANLFNNPGFESGDLTGWTIKHTENGQTLWETVTTIDIDGGGPLGDSFAGDFCVGKIDYYGPNGGIDLTQMLNLQAGVEYTIEYDYAIYMEWDPYWEGNAHAGDFGIVVDGNQLLYQYNGSIDRDTWLYGHISTTYTPGATGTYDVGARMVREYLSSDLLHQYVDNFYITPAPGALALLGLAGLIGRRRR